MRALVLLASLVVGLAAGPVSAQELKIGFVDIPYLIDNAPVAKSASEALEREFAPLQDEIRSRRDELNRKLDELKKNGLIMTEAQRSALEREVRRLERQVKREEQDFREELNIQKNNEFKKVRKAILEAINAFAESQGYDLILSETVLFSSKRVDLTEQILQELGKAQKAQ